MIILKLLSEEVFDFSSGQVSAWQNLFSSASLTVG
jgi:hypothetical protein